MYCGIQCLLFYYWSFCPLYKVVTKLISVLAYVSVSSLVVINNKINQVGVKTWDVAVSYFKRNSHYGVDITEVARVENEGNGGQEFLDAICTAYHSTLEQGNPPDLVLDFTMSGSVSEAAKTFTSALALPTVATTFGQTDDIRTWQNLQFGQQKYLIQISPPADIVPEIVRSLVIYQNLTNAGVLFDSSYEMDHKYKALLRNLPTRHILINLDQQKAIKDLLIRLRNLDVVNFFIIGNLSTIKNVLDMANVNEYFNKKFAWHAITQETGQLSASCKNATVLFIQPQLSPTGSRQLVTLLKTYSLMTAPEITSAFYFDVIVRSVLALKSMAYEWPKKFNYTSCNDYNEENPPIRRNLDFRKYLQEVQEIQTIGPLRLRENGQSYMKFNMSLKKVQILNSKIVSSNVVGMWKAGLNKQIIVFNESAIANFSAVEVFRVVTVLQKPFMMFDKTKEGNDRFSGYCVDLLKEISQILGFEYEIYLSPNNSFGYRDKNGQWNGMVRELLDKRAEIAIASLYVTAERENVIDYTVPYYDLVGITILMKKPMTPTSLFKFLNVLETNVWLCILAAYLFTSFIMWVFDRYSPYSYQNNKEKFKDDDEQREFTLRECLWFCMTSLTPQGGGEAPKNLSGRLVAATWWLFGFIIIASYTANLAAFLTVSRLDTPVESLDDLAKQYKIQYAPLQGSWVQTYFKRMADIEERFYKIWKAMTLNTSMSPIERAQLAVWDYPLSDKYTKLWRSMTQTGFPRTLDGAVKRVLASKSSSEGFAFLGDAIDIKYSALINCELQMVGDEFSRKPFAVAVQQGSPLKDSLNNAILQLLNKRKLEKLKEIWWNQNPDRHICEKPDDQADGISIYNIGGVFIVIFVGIGLACITLAFEYWWMKYKKPKSEVAGGMTVHRSKLSENVKSTYTEFFPGGYSVSRIPKDNIPYRRKEHGRW